MLVDEFALRMYLLCDDAMCADCGIAESYGCGLGQLKTIAKRDGTLNPFVLKETQIPAEFRTEPGQFCGPVFTKI